MIIGIVKNRSVEKNRDGENDVRMLGVDLYMDGNTESVQLARPAGEDSNPPDDAIVYVLPAGDAYKIGFVIDDGITPDMDKGEKKIYSVDAGAIKAYINFLKNGNIELNGNSKSFVTHSELNTALQNFVTALNLHTHPTAAPGPPSPPTAPMSIDISASETTTIKTGG